MRSLVLTVALVVAAAAPAAAQISADQIAVIAKRVHDAERVDLGAGSTREGRNAFWAQVMGIVVHGHPVYNPTPDPSWCIKDGGGGRPQSDDVAVQCASRLFWDCIGNAGAPGYTFRCNPDHGPLPPEQNVYSPPVPRGGGGVITPPTSDLWTAAHQALRTRLGAGATTQRIAEQLAYSFPAEGWGTKRADPTRDISGDVIARLQGTRLWGVRVVPAVTEPPFDITGQIFVGAPAVNHLGDSGPTPTPTPPPVPPTEPPTEPPTPPAFPGIDALRAALEAISAELNALRTELADTAKTGDVKALLDNLCLRGRVPKALGGSTEVTFCRPTP